MMRSPNDEVTEVVMADDFMLKYGSDLISKYHDTDRMLKYINSRLREIARFLIELRLTLGSVDGSVKQLFCARNWRAIVETTRSFCSNFCGYYGAGGEFKYF